MYTNNIHTYIYTRTNDIYILTHAHFDPMSCIECRSAMRVVVRVAVGRWGWWGGTDGASGGAGDGVSRGSPRRQQ